MEKVIGNGIAKIEIAGTGLNRISSKQTVEARCTPEFEGFREKDVQVGRLTAYGK